MNRCTDPRVLATGAPDPTKHVNFERGMVLGEDEFKQEFAWLSGRDQWLARDLIGYGTVRGLKVQVEQDGSKGWRVYVHPGAALTPVGQLVCVPTPQCANLNDWLKKNAAKVQPAVASPPQNPLPLYVVLCYRECLDDNVPIPGEPCRSEDELVKPSRVRDDFALEISLERPVHREEKALINFCERLREVNMTDKTATSPPLADFLNWLRGIDGGVESPPASPPTSPPGGVRVHPDDAAKYLRAAFHLWTTELRPKWFARWYGCAPSKDEPAPLEDCVLLAKVKVPLVFNAGTGAYQVTDTEPPVVSDTPPPYVLHLRMLQEWLIGGGSALPSGTGSAGAATFVTDETSFGLSSDVGTSLAYARADHTHGTPTLPPVPSPATMVVAETSFGLASALGTSSNYAREDHTHGTPPLSALPALGGDAIGPIPTTTVNRVRGIDVITTPASDGDLLVFDLTSNSWQPRGLPTIVAAAKVRFQLSANGVPPGSQAVPIAPPYNGLVPIGVYDPANGGFRFTFNGFDFAANYFVKLTPWVAPFGPPLPAPLPPVPRGFSASFFDFVQPAGGLAAGFTVTIGLIPGLAPPLPNGRLMIEVTRVG